MTRTLINRVVPGKVDLEWPTDRRRYQPLFIDIEIDDRNGNPELSITGVEGPKRNGDAWGSCGQCRDSLDRIEQLGDGWTAGMVAELKAIWERWHLNGMNAGSPAQSAWLRENPVEAIYPESHYDKACTALAAVGLNPDGDYRYGSQWLYEEVPDEIIEWLRNLPTTTLTYPWGT